MSDIQSFISQAAGSLGVSPDKATSAASGLLGLIQDKVSGGDAAALLKALPGAADLVKSPESGAKSGGMLGGLVGAAGGLLGGKAGSALTVLSIFKKSGLDTDQAGSFVGMFMDYVTKNAGGDLVGRILEQIPELKNLVSKHG